MPWAASKDASSSGRCAGGEMRSGKCLSLHFLNQPLTYLDLLMRVLQNRDHVHCKVVGVLLTQNLKEAPNGHVARECPLASGHRICVLHAVGSGFDIADADGDRRMYTGQKHRAIDTPAFDHLHLSSAGTSFAMQFDSLFEFTSHWTRRLTDSSFFATKWNGENV